MWQTLYLVIMSLSNDCFSFHSINIVPKWHMSDCCADGATCFNTACPWRRHASLVCCIRPRLITMHLIGLPFCRLLPPFSSDNEAHAQLANKTRGGADIQHTHKYMYRKDSGWNFILSRVNLDNVWSSRLQIKVYEFIIMEINSPQIYHLK